MTMPCTQPPYIKSEATHVAPSRIWYYWAWLWHGVFYLLLTSITGISLFQNTFTRQQSILLLVLVLLLATWYSLCITIHTPAWRRRPLITYGYLLIGWGICFSLTSFDPLYLTMLLGLSAQLSMLLPKFWKVPATLLLTALALWRIFMLVGTHYEIFLIILGTVSLCLITALYIEQIFRQSQEKDQLLRELATTRQELTTVERQAGAIQERQRLAHEIHDTLAQGFTSIIMQTEAAEVACDQDKEGTKEYLKQIRCTARENLNEARRLMWALQPEALEKASLPTALTHLAEKWSKASGIVTHTSITGSIYTLRPEIEVTLLRAVQEALANILKHAHARHVAITLSYMDDIAVLDVQDDGIGFQVEHLSAPSEEYLSGGFGLKALRERAEQLQGTLSIESMAGEGTTFTIALPAILASSYLTHTQFAPIVGEQSQHSSGQDGRSSIASIPTTGKGDPS